MIGKKWDDTRLQNLQKTCGDCTNRRYRSQHFSLCFFACGAWRGQYRNGHSNRRACLERSGGREWSELCGVSPPHGERECLRGFAPARRGSFALLRTGSFVSAKGSKTMGAQARPFGCLCHSPEWFGLRNSLRSNSPRLSTRKFGTAAQPRLQAPSTWRHGWRCFLPSVIPDSIGDPRSLLFPVFAKRTTLDPRRLPGSIL